VAVDQCLSTWNSSQGGTINNWHGAPDRLRVACWDLDIICCELAREFARNSFPANCVDTEQRVIFWPTTRAWRFLGSEDGNCPEDLRNWIVRGIRIFSRRKSGGAGEQEAFLCPVVARLPRENLVARGRRNSTFPQANRAAKFACGRNANYRAAVPLTTSSRTFGTLGTWRAEVNGGPFNPRRC